MPFKKPAYSIILPARNEAPSLKELLPRLVENHPDAEILVIDDGSTDDTLAICQAHGIEVVLHINSIGNGAAIKTGARAAKGSILVFMDADGQHRHGDVDLLLEKLNEGYDMAVGARIPGSHAGVFRAIANGLYNHFASWMVGQTIVDLTSGFRAVHACHFRKFLYLLPNGFSYPTTITICFFRAGYRVAYVPIFTPRRIGRSNIRPLRDGLKFLLIILKIGTLYSPLKLFLPISIGFFITGLGYYLHTFFSSGRFTNMSALLFIAAILTFLIGIVSEQISTLHYKGIDGEGRDL